VLSILHIIYRNLAYTVTCIGESSFQILASDICSCCRNIHHIRQPQTYQSSTHQDLRMIHQDKHKILERHMFLLEGISKDQVYLLGKFLLFK